MLIGWIVGGHGGVAQEWRRDIHSLFILGLVESQSISATISPTSFLLNTKIHTSFCLFAQFIIFWFVWLCFICFIIFALLVFLPCFLIYSGSVFNDIAVLTCQLVFAVQ